MGHNYAPTTPYFDIFISKEPSATTKRVKRDAEMMLASLASLRWRQNPSFPPVSCDFVQNTKSPAVHQKKPYTYPKNIEVDAKFFKKKKKAIFFDIFPTFCSKW